MIQFDSRKVKKGDIFVAIKGLNFDGHDFVNEAIEKGAKEVYGEKEINNPKYFKVENSQNKLGQLASNYYQDPSKKLKLIGVTGTKGKTTTCHLIHHILESKGKKVGLISTLTTNGSHVTSSDVITLNKRLSKMVRDGYEYCILEVSSHGIDQGRIAGINFYISVLTNIAPEHLDYHKTFKNYKKVKMSFVNSVDMKIISPKITKLNILNGYFNNLNAETAISVCKLLGITTDESLKSLKFFKLPKGRLEEIRNSKGIKIFIDFAHTPDSLRAVLSYLKQITPGRLISVFGCAGERDFLKRPKMGKIASVSSDIVILTTEDPRSEKATDIITNIKAGMPKNFKNVYEVVDREMAIKKAINEAVKGDTVVMLGKGHENTMNLDGVNEVPWSDRNTIKKILSNKT